MTQHRRLQLLADRAGELGARGDAELAELSTFVMIGQNRADAKRQVIADQRWRTVKEEDEQNRELLDLSE